MGRVRLVVLRILITPFVSSYTSYTKWAILQLYHDVNKLHNEEMMMKSVLYWTNTH